MIIELREEDSTNEAEYFGNVEAGSSVRFSRLLEWMNNVGSSENAAFLKCVVSKANGCTIFNVSDIMFDSNIVHKDTTYANGVKIAFKESAGEDSMSVARAAELFNAIAEQCKQNEISLDDVQVFTLDSNGKLSRFCWFYDDQFDTAYIVRNMNPGAARKWLQAGAEVAAEIAKSPKKPRVNQEKELYSYWVEIFGAEDAAKEFKSTFPGKRIPKI